MIAPPMIHAGNRVKHFWEKNGCGSQDVTHLQEGSLEYFEAIEKIRFQGDDFMAEVAGFDRWKGRKVLEVGCGLGTDLLQFVRRGAEVFAVDLTNKGASLTARRLALYGFQGGILAADGESLPFSNDSFDFVYCWGVIHHTSNPDWMVRELIRVSKPGGQVLAMIYHRYSLVALQAWLWYGLFRGRPWLSAREIISEHLESPGTRIYTRNEALALFNGLEGIQIKTLMTRYDIRLGRRLFLPRWCRSLVPNRWGWFLVVKGSKPSE